jgi:ABC-2 type transport system permease protein
MNPRNSGIIAKKELRGLYNEKTIILAILLQLFIAMFSSFLMVGLASMYDPESIARFSSATYPVGYAGEESDLERILEESGDFRVYPMDLSTALQALRERKLTAVIYMPDTPPDGTDPVKLTFYTIQNDIQATVVNVKLKEAFLEYEEALREIRADRLDARPLPLDLPEGVRGGAEFFEFVYGLLIPLLVFMPAIIASALVIDLICEEIQHHTLETLLSTPISFQEVIWGKIAACFVLVPVQAGAWLLLLMANGIRIAHAGTMLLHASVASLAVILLATLAALHYRERTNAQFIFSTALVAVLLLTLALPSNPANLLVRLSVSAIGGEHWIMLAGVAGMSVLLGATVSWYAGRVGDEIFTLR